MKGDTDARTGDTHTNGAGAGPAGASPPQTFADVRRMTAEAPAPDASAPSNPAQPALVPMSEEELRDAGRLLANLVDEKKAMVTRHQGERVDMKKERTDLDERIQNVARTIREQGR